MKKLERKNTVTILLMANYTPFNDAVKAARPKTGRKKVDALKEALKKYPVNLVNEK